MAKEPLHGNPQQQGFSAAQKKGKTTSGYYPTDEQAQTFQFVYRDRYRMMKESRDRTNFMRDLDKWERQWEGYRVIRDENKDEWQSNHTVPMTISVVQTAVSEIVRQNIRPFFRPRGPADQPTITLLQHIWDYAWEVSHSDLMLYDVVMDLLINGTAITQEYYKKDYVYRYTRSLSEDQRKVLEKHKVLDYDDVCGEIVKPQEFFVDETARGFSGPYSARDCIRRYIMDINDFHLVYDGSPWDMYQNAHLVTPGGDTSYYEWYKPPEQIDSTKQVEVLHYWAERPIDRWVITANQVVVYDGENPYKHKRLPFAKADDVKRVHRFYSKGEPEILESIQDEANTLRRMIIDRNHLDIDKMFFVSNKLGLDEEDTVARPHGIIPTDDVNGAKPIEYGDIPRSVELSYKHLEDDSTIGTGINPRAQSLPQSTTATEAAILKESTLRRIETKVWLLRKSYLRRIGELRFSNIMQFYKQPQIEEIVGKEGTDEYENQIQDLTSRGRIQEVEGKKYAVNYRQIPIKQKQLSFGATGMIEQPSTDSYTFFELNDDAFRFIERGRFAVRFDSGPNIEISKPLQQQKDLELFDRLLQVAQMFPGSYDPVKLGDMVVRDYEKNPDDLKPEQQVDQNEEANQRMKLQLQLAQMENTQMMNSMDVPATPFASPAHTLIHIDFFDKQPLQSTDPKQKAIIEIFTKHIMGEIMAQQAREMQGGQGIPPQQFMPPGGSTAPNFQAQPGTNPTSVSQGITNRPGGMAQPQMKTSDVTQQLNTGGSQPKR